MHRVLQRALKKLGYALGSALDSRIWLRQAIKAGWHLAGIPLAYWFAFWLRFDGAIPENYWELFGQTLPLLMTVCLMSFFALRLFSDLWSYFSVDDLVRLMLAVTLAVAVYWFAVDQLLEDAPLRAPRSVLLLFYLLLGLWLSGGRLAARYLRKYRGGAPVTRETLLDRMLLVGRLAEADMVIRASRQSGLGEVVGVVGDDAGNQNVLLHGIRVFHRRMEDVGRLAREMEPDSIVILPPYNRPQPIRSVMAAVAAEGLLCKFRIVPSLGDLAAGHLTASSVRDVDIEDLLSRGEVRLDRTEVRRYLKGKRVMITGAGGSIGSELVRQVAGYEPEAVVLFEQSEYGLYLIEQEIVRRYPNLRVIAVAGDVQRPASVQRALREAGGGVEVVFHAAAYKHVPLMEKNVPASFRANVLGTACVAREAVRAGVDRFVFVSSDKAVRPSSIMGATKRLAERVLAEMDSGRTTFVSVRFGNVLGSSGSVVPQFQQQIREGGPVTVTTPNMRRFFMTIPEAVDLLLQAGTVGRNREIMVLEMGEEIRIVDLAKRLIELSGLVPDKDIKIEFTGLRPGEKEYEEVMTEDENVVKTAYEKIWVMTKTADARPTPPVDLLEIERRIDEGDIAGLRDLARRWIPENCMADSAPAGSPT